MISVQLKLRPHKKLEQTLEDWLLTLTSIYNWGLKKFIRGSNLDDWIQSELPSLEFKKYKYKSEKDFQNVLPRHSKKLGIPSHTIQATLTRSRTSWIRMFEGLSEQPKFKGVHNKLKSIPFPDTIPKSKFKGNSVRLPGIGKVNFHKQEIPEGKIKQGLIKKKASGWYLYLIIDTNRTFPVKETEQKVGIDTGFKHLAVLSDGTKIENNRYYSKIEKRLAQAQRGRRTKLASKLQEKAKNQKTDYNHKVSRKIVQDFNEIYITNDNLKSQQKQFGKSINNSGIGQLRNFISYKSDNHNRKCKLVESSKSTKTCSSCGNLTGPTGKRKLAVREWVCSACGAHHDRDINAALNTLHWGLVEAPTPGPGRGHEKRKRCVSRT